MKTQLLAFILIFTILIKTEPSADLIKETREKIAQINIAFLKNDYPDNSTIDEFSKLLSELKNDKILLNSISAGKEHEIRPSD